jgi:hypothetical protein
MLLFQEGHPEDQQDGLDMAAKRYRELIKELAELVVSAFHARNS